MTPEEMKAMEGTEFTYVFHDGDTMKAYVKKVDLESGKMSCWSFSLTTDQGYTFDPMGEDEEKEGACCVSSSSNIEEMEEKLTEIKDTGRLCTTLPDGIPGIFSGCPF